MCGTVAKIIASPFTLGVDTLARKGLGSSGKQLTPITSAVDKGLGIKSTASALPAVDPVDTGLLDQRAELQRQRELVDQRLRRGRRSTFITQNAPQNSNATLG